jgi:hypothetical protein
MTSGLQDALDSKQNVLPSTNALTIEQITNLQPFLDSKIDSSLVYNQTDIDEKLSHKQNVIKTGDLSILMSVD